MTYTIEVEADGSLRLPREILAEAKSAARYIVEAQGDQLMLRPEESETAPQQMSGSEWLAAWDELAVKLTQSSTTDRSVVEILSEMRR